MSYSISSHTIDKMIFARKFENKNLKISPQLQISSLQDQLLKYEQNGSNKLELENNTVKSKSG